MNHAKFFDAIRPMFGRMTQAQVDGCETLLAACDGMQVEHAAYVLATAYHETARTMQPISERGGDAYFKRMYDLAGARPHVARALGNTQFGDGARFHGRGYVQLTGRANYAKAGAAVGVDLVADPEKAKHPTVAARIAIRGMQEGWFTGKRLRDYLPGDYRNARRIINGVDCASAIAGYAERFEDALRAAGWGAGPIRTADAIQDQPAAFGGISGAIAAFLRGFAK